MCNLQNRSFITRGVQRVTDTPDLQVGEEVDPRPDFMFS
jgi:hypothetical protein